MKKPVLYLVVILLTHFVQQAQNQNKKWYFSNQAGLDFMTTPPTVLNNSAMNAFEGCSSIADANGNLLFYTDGMTVWNKSHQVMANGMGLLGDPSATQSGLIVKQPGNANIYFIFTLDYIGRPKGLRYTMVDLNLASGMGSVTTKNVQLFTSSTEKLSATRHCNGNDIWIVTHDYPGNSFRSFLLTSSGINPPVISSAGMNIIDSLQAQGGMKISPTGNKLCACTYSIKAGNLPVPLFELFNFDNSTGIISNPFLLAVEDNRYLGYSCEFSPDGTKLYGCTHVSWAQWDLCAGSNSAIAASAYTVAFPIHTDRGQMQRAANGKIYVTFEGGGGPVLDVINNPNSAGATCNYVYGGQSIAPGMSRLGLPNILFDKIPTPPFTYSANTPFHCYAMSFTAPHAPTMTVTACTSVGYSLTNLVWNFGDPSSGLANVSPIPNPTHIYPGPGTYTATLIYYYSCGGGTDTLRQQVSVGATPLSSSSNFSLCTGQSTTLTASGNITYTWNTGSNSSTLAINPSTTTSYTVWGTDISGCTNTSVQTIPVFPAATISIFGTPTLCLGSTLTQTASGAFTYTWSNGSFSNITSFSPQVNATYTVTGKSSNGCVDQQVVNITVFPLPSLTITGSQAVCPGSSLNLVASGAGNYTWNIGSTKPPIISPTLITVPASNGIYTLTGSSSAGCTNSINASIYINPLPSVSINGNVLICPGETTTLNAGGTATSYTWSTGVATNSVALSPTIASGYTLSGTAANGCTNTAVTTIALKPAPSITVSGTNSLCAGASVIQTASGANSYTWTNNAITTTVNLNPALTSIYTVSGSGFSGCVGHQTVIITVFPLPVLTISGSTAICYGSTVSLLAGGASTYSWSNGTTGDNLISAGLINTNYTLTGTDSLGCVNQKTLSTIVLTLPSLSITGNFPVCTGESILLGATGANSFTWSTGSNSNVLNTIPASSTVYTLSGTNSSGCVADKTVAVIVNPLPALSVSGSTEVCLGIAATLTATGALTYTWNTGYIGSSVSFLPGATTIYTVSGIDLNGCRNTSSVTVIVNPIPVTFFSYPNVCTGGDGVDPVKLEGFSTGGSFSSNTIKVNPQSGRVDLKTFGPGTYFIKYTIPDAKCISQDSGAILQILPAEPPELIPEITVAPAQPFTLEAKGGSDYSWSPYEDLNCVDCPNPVITSLQTRRYCVSALVKGCRSEACVNVIVSCDIERSYSLPNAFTPNGDGNNDEFCLQGWRYCLKSFNVMIFDRWGEKVFESNDPDFCWDGVYKGKLLDTDVFLFVVSARTEKNEIRKKGNITLMR